MEDDIEEPTALNLASVKDLIDELMSRHTRSIIVLDNDLTMQGSGDIITVVKGNYFHCLGLCEYAKERVFGLLYGEDENELL